MASVTTARFKYGVWALLIALSAVIAGLMVAGWLWDDNEAALAAVTGVVGTVIGAYFGVQAGAAATDQATQARDDAVTQREEAVQERNQAIQKKDALAGANTMLAAKLSDNDVQPILRQFNLAG